MVRALSQQCSMQKSISFNLKKMFDVQGRHAHSCVCKNNVNDQNKEVSYDSTPKGDSPQEHMNTGWALKQDKAPVSCLDPTRIKCESPGKPHSDIEMLKERFAKLLLGEDMSGGGKGVSSALALSNAITNLAASVFGEQRKLEPMPQERKARWRKEVEWLLSVTDHIVEFAPAQQKSEDGGNMEIMTTRQRIDIHMNIPALRKLDAMLIGYLDNFGDQNEFWYGSKYDDDDDAAAADSDKENAQRHDDKWWIPTVKVPPEGLSDAYRKWLFFMKDSVNQIHKAAMAINAQVLSEMEVPENYIESLPKNGRESLGEPIYKSITDEYFNPEHFLSIMDLSTEHKVIDLKNRIEASIIIWKRKMHQQHKDGKSSWSSGVSLEKRELFEERAEVILLILKQRFPGISQSSLEISKIQYNKDVGYAVLESYSRIIETLASQVMSRIEDVLRADSLNQTTSNVKNHGRSSMDSSLGSVALKSPNSEENQNDDLNSSTDTPTKTLSDFMGWGLPKDDAKPNDIDETMESYFKEENDKMLKKPAITNPKKSSYLEKLENLSGLRSPTARH